MKKISFILALLFSFSFATYAEPTQNTSQWKSAITTPSGKIQKIKFFNHDKKIFLCMSDPNSAEHGRLYYSTDASTWIPDAYLPTDPIDVLSDAKNKNLYLISASSGTPQLYKWIEDSSSVEGGAWQKYQLDNVSSATADSNGVIYAYTFNPANKDHQIYRFDPNTTQWEAIGFDAFDKGLTTSVSLALDSHGTLYAGDERSLYIYPHDTKTWHQVPYMDVLKRDGIAIDSHDNIYITYLDLVAKSTDHGQTFTVMNTGYPQDALLNSITVDHEGNVYAGTLDYGVLKLAAGTTRWEAMNEGLPKYPNPIHFSVNNSGSLYTILWSDDLTIYKWMHN